MPWIVLAAIATASSVSILMMVNLYLYYCYKQRFLKLWAIAWGVLVIRYLSMVVSAIWKVSFLPAAVYYLSIIISATILVQGTRNFIGKPSAKWLNFVGAVIALWAIVALSSGMPNMSYIIPVFAFLSTAYIMIGAQVLKQTKQGEHASRITGWFFIAWGVHQADYPLLRPIEWFAPWGFLIGSILATATAIGMILIYFERLNLALKREEERYKNIVESSQNWIWEVDAKSIFTYSSHHVQELLGYAPEEIVGKSSFDLMSGDEASRIRDIFVKISSKKEPYHLLETPLQHKDGRLTVMEISGVPFYDERENYCGYRGMGIDITERKRIEAAVRNSEAYFRSLFENSFAGVMVLDEELIFTDSNRELCNLLGYAKEELVGKMRILDLVHPDDRDNSTEIGSLLSVHRQEETVSEKRYITKTGKIVTVLRHVNGLYGQDGEYLGSISSVLDITRLKQIEEERLTFEQQLQHTQKLESLGVLSGGIAHDFNNILAVIIGYCGLTKMNYETAEKNITEIEKAAERAAGLCHQMLAYAGKAQITRTRVNMVTKVDDIITMLKTSLPRNAVIKADLSAQIPLIEGDASQLRQVVMNLIINASEAIGTEQGEVQISLARIDVVPGKSYEDYHSKPIPLGGYVCLEVSDDGCGMDETTKRRIFEPFYTTKFTGRGLGMSAVLGIINSHGGAVQLFSQRGKGTTFKVYLPFPAQGTAEEENLIPPAPAAPWKGSGTILLVEDEDAIRDIAKTFLETFGFIVLDAVNGRNALELYQRNAADIRLVITDLGMPVMDGYALFSALKQLNSKLPIIISSGFGDADVSSRIGTDNLAGMVNKPYNPSQLREVLKNALEGKAPALA